MLRIATYYLSLALIFCGLVATPEIYTGIAHAEEGIPVFDAGSTLKGVGGGGGAVSGLADAASGLLGGGGQQGLACKAPTVGNIASVLTSLLSLLPQFINKIPGLSELFGLLGDEVPVRDLRNILVNTQQLIELQKIADIDKQACDTLRVILATLGSLNVPEDLIVYMSKATALYYEISLQSEFHDKTQASTAPQSGAVEAPQMNLHDQPLAGFLNLGGGFNNFIIDFFGGFFGLSGSNIDLIKKITGLVSKYLGSFFKDGKFPLFGSGNMDPKELLSGVLETLYGNSSMTGNNATGDDWLNSYLKDIDLEGLMDEIFGGGGGGGGGGGNIFGGGVFGRTLDLKELQKIVTDMHYCDEKLSKEECAETILPARSMMRTNVAINQSAQSLGVMGNTRKFIEELVTGTAQKACSGAGSDKPEKPENKPGINQNNQKCIALMPMIMTSTNLRQDVQNLTAAEFTSFILAMYGLEVAAVKSMADAENKLATDQLQYKFDNSAQD